MAIITISRGTFSGGEKLAELVAEKLGYKCLSREILLEASQKYHVPLKKLVHTLDDAPGVLERMGMERQRYLACIKSTLLNDIQKDNIVYHGHAGHLLLKGVAHTLRVRIIAGMEYRIKAAMKRNALGRDQAAAFIRNIDNQRMKWTHFLYHEAINDPSLYDIIINLENNTSLETARDIICSSVEAPEYKSTLTSKKKLRDFTLAAEIEAAIALDFDIKSKNMGVEADDGVIKVVGKTESLRDSDKIRKLIRHHSGVKSIKCNLHTKSWGMSFIAS